MSIGLLTIGVQKNPGVNDVFSDVRPPYRSGCLRRRLVGSPGKPIKLVALVMIIVGVGVLKLQTAY